MPSAYSFIDLAVLDDVRERFARGEAVAILSTDLDQVIWANGPGARLFGEADIDAVIGASPGLASPARRQIMATSGYPDIGRDRSAVVRLTSGMESRVIRFLVSGVSLPDGEPAIILAQPSEQTSPETAISGLSGPGQFAAVIGARGEVLAASNGFAGLRLDAGVLIALALETSPAQRVVKRVVTGERAGFPAGLARLSDDPARFLLIVVDEAGAATADTAGPAMPADAAEFESAETGVLAMGGAELDHDYPGPDAGGTADTGSVHLPQQPSGEASPKADDQAEQADHADEQDPAQADGAPEDGGLASGQRSEPVRPMQIDRSAQPVRFVWRTAADGRFSMVSSEFAEAVGHQAADVIGRSFGEVASAFGLDSGHEVGGLLERRDTWSGRTVFWPIAGMALRVPVDLAALPVYDRDRRFEGFRGFGVVRLADVVADPEGAGLALVAPAAAAQNEPAARGASDAEAGPVEAADTDDPFQGEVPALALVPKAERRLSDKVVRLAERRPAVPEKGLSPVERSAFREIGERLKKDRSGARGPAAESAVSEIVAGTANTNQAAPVLPKTAEHAETAVAEILDRVAAHRSDETAQDVSDQPALASAEDGPVAGELEPGDPVAGEPEPQQPVSVARRRKRRIAFRYEHDVQTQDQAGQEAVSAATPAEDLSEDTPDLPPEAPVMQPTSAGTAQSLGHMDKQGGKQEAQDGAAADDAPSTEEEIAILMAAVQRPDHLDATAAEPVGDTAAIASEPAELPADGGGGLRFGPNEFDGDFNPQTEAEPTNGLFGEPEEAVAVVDGWTFATGASEEPGAAEHEAAPKDLAPQNSAMDPAEDPDTGSESEELAYADSAPDELEMPSRRLEATPGEQRGATVPDAQAPDAKGPGSLGPSDFDAAALDYPEQASLAFEQDEQAEAPEAATPAAQEPAKRAAQYRASSTAKAGAHSATGTRPDSAAAADAAFAGFPGTRASEHGPLEQQIIDRLPVPILIHAGDALHYANPEFLYLTGYHTLNDLRAAGGLGALFADPYSGDDNARNRVLRLRTGDGLEFPIEALLRSVSWDSGTALMLVVKRTGEEPSDTGEEPSEAVAPPGQTAVAAPESRDASSDTAASRQLAELQARFAEMRTIMDTATDGVVLIRPDGTIRSISRPAEALFGFDSSDVEGKPFTSLFAIESQRAARDYLAGLAEHGVASVLNDGREVIGREAEGRFIPLFMTIGKLPEDGGYCAVMRDITQWKRAEEELTQAKTLAERASSQKTEFLARISHEIRTPLNAIIGFSELMMDERFGPVGNDRYRDYLRDINRSGNHVLDLVNDLLDISKIEAGQQEMNYEAVSLNETLAETVAMMQPQANRERVIIRSSFASKLPEVVADLRSVRQIALNILSNAIRYTQAGGQVIVSTAYEPSGDIALRVRDTGIGMSNAEIEQAMKPFKQINALKRGRGDGTGLGLPLTKAMVEANRARFTIASTPGEGTLVEVTFPATRVLAG